MNLIDVYVTKIITPAHKNTDGDFCCWEVEVETDCYGSKEIKIIRKTTKREIDMIKVGYSWLG